MPLITTLAGASARGYGGLRTFGVPSSYESIATVTVGSGGSATVEFTSIPSTYTHLQIRALIRSTYTSTVTTTNGTLQFNSDTGSNYAWHQLRGQGSAASTGASSSTNLGLSFADIGGTSVTNFFSAGVMDILDYTNTNKYKTVRVLTGADGNTTNDDWIYLGSTLWQNTSAITSIKLYPGINNFAQYTRFALYGIKGA